MTELTLWLQLMGKKYKSSSVSMSMYTNINLTNLGMLSCLEMVHKSGQALAVSVPTNNNTHIYIYIDAKNHQFSKRSNEQNVQFQMHG